MSKWLVQTVKEANAPKVSILDVLKQNLGSYGPSRSMDVVHASDTTKADFCPRKWAFYDMAGKSTTMEHVGAGMQATYDVGNLTADLFRERWAGQAAVGNWKCRRCNEQRTMCSKPAIGCTKSSDCQWQYVEVRFESLKYDISGSLDVLMNLGAPQLFVTELKILKVADFDAMLAPMPEHRIRTSLYMKLIADSDSAYKNKINLHEARVLYVSRGYGKLVTNETMKEILPFKEYVVKRDDESIKQPLQRAKQIKIFREQKLMPSGICGTALDKYAKSCNKCIICFSGNHPSEQEALV